VGLVVPILILGAIFDTVWPDDRLGRYCDWIAFLLLLCVSFLSLIGLQIQYDLRSPVGGFW
jgi:hypothetical protein